MDLTNLMDLDASEAYYTIDGWIGRTDGRAENAETRRVVRVEQIGGV